MMVNIITSRQERRSSSPVLTAGDGLDGDDSYYNCP
jgi:hypothetical protein